MSERAGGVFRPDRYVQQVRSDTIVRFEKMTAVAGVNDDAGSHPEPTEHGFALGPYSVLTSVGAHRKRDGSPITPPPMTSRPGHSEACGGERRMPERHGDPGSVDRQRLMAEAEEYAGKRQCRGTRQRLSSL